MALAKLAVAPQTESGPNFASLEILPGGSGEAGVSRESITDLGWPVFASLSWGAVMYLFRWHPDTIQPSLRSSMTYLYAPPPPFLDSHGQCGIEWMANDWMLSSSLCADM